MNSVYYLIIKLYFLYILNSIKEKKPSMMFEKICLKINYTIAI